MTIIVIIIINIILVTVIIIVVFIIIIIIIVIVIIIIVIVIIVIIVVTTLIKVVNIIITLQLSACFPLHWCSHTNLILENFKSIKLLALFSSSNSYLSKFYLFISRNIYYIRCLLPCLW